MVSFALHGIGVSSGIAIGRAQLVSHATLEVAHYHISTAQVDEARRVAALGAHDLEYANGLRGY